MSANDLMSDSDEDDFRNAMARLKSGDQIAARDIFERYVHRLIALASTRIGGKLRRKVDPEDLVQSVFNSFFARQVKDQYTLQNWDGLWGLLAAITIHKCGHKIAHFHAACRDVDGEASSAILTGESRADWEAVARDPSPHQLAIFDETIVGLMNEFDEREGQVFVLFLQGWSVEEIAAEVSRSERTTRRVLERVRQRLESELLDAT
jgi:RNA polymerase sigma-70 factor (ECF subfamily)